MLFAPRDGSAALSAVLGRERRKWGDGPSESPQTQPMAIDFCPADEHPAEVGAGSGPHSVTSLEPEAGGGHGMEKRGCAQPRKRVGSLSLFPNPLETAGSFFYWRWV